MVVLDLASYTQGRRMRWRCRTQCAASAMDAPLPVSSTTLRCGALCSLPLFFSSLLYHRRSTARRPNPSAIPTRFLHQLSTLSLAPPPPDPLPNSFRLLHGREWVHHCQSPLEPHEFRPSPTTVLCGPISPNQEHNDLPYTPLILVGLFLSNFHVPSAAGPPRPWPPLACLGQCQRQGPEGVARHGG